MLNLTATPSRTPKQTETNLIKVWRKVNDFLALAGERESSIGELAEALISFPSTAPASLASWIADLRAVKTKH